MMKLLFILLFCLFSHIAQGQYSSSDFNSGKFTAFSDIELKFNEIVPDADYAYWRCVSADHTGIKNSEPMITERVVTEKGDQKYAKYIKKKKSLKGFLVNGGPVFSYYYIAAVRKDKKVEVINTDPALRSFIGKIDNMEEVKLLARCNKLSVNLKRKDTGSYLKVGDSYLLYLFDHLDSCIPGGAGEQSVKAILKANNELLILNRTSL